MANIQIHDTVGKTHLFFLLNAWGIFLQPRARVRKNRSAIRGEPGECLNSSEGGTFWSGKSAATARNH